jgi:oligopeptide transport system substrate-binding protein
VRGLRIAVAAALAVLVVGTVVFAITVLRAGVSGTGTGEALSPDQTLSFPIAADVSELDPAQIASPGDVDIFRNVFSGLYRFDSRLHVMPDIATGPPDVSADGLTYTFHLRHDAAFSNGDSVTADDFIYSWNRAAAKQGEYADLFAPVAGYGAVVGGTTTRLSGLVKVDDFTFSSKLTRAAGYWPTVVALWPFWVVDRKVIASAGENSWFNSPTTLVGSGPFRLSSRTPGQTLDFEPVPKWYGGKTGAITHVHVEVVGGLDVQLSRYESGLYSLIGYARQSLSPAAAVKYTSGSTLSGQLHLVPAALTYWVGFNYKSGLFAGDAGKAGRHAFATAIDRAALATAVCSGGTSCAPADGGLISKGLMGYLGDGADPNTKFNAAAAKAEYAAWDRVGLKVRGLTFTYDTNPFNKAVCGNLAAQWKANLGVTVACVEVDRKNFFDRRNGRCGYSLFRQSWSADYDHPQNWFDYLFTSQASSSGSCFSSTKLDNSVAQADKEPPAQALPLYQAADRLLIENVVYSALFYGVQQYLVQPYVRGVGGNALYDFDWTQARVLAH